MWITERQSKSISKVDPKTGKHTVLYTFKNAVAAPPHQGVLGLALDPQFLKGNNYVYTAYTYEVNGEKHARIVRMTYDPKTETLRDETAISIICRQALTITPAACVLALTASCTTPSVTKGIIRISRS